MQMIIEAIRQRSPKIISFIGDKLSKYCATKDLTNKNISTQDKSASHCTILVRTHTIGGVKAPDVGTQIKHRHALQTAKLFIKEREGLCLKTYRCSANVLTIGYGHTATVKEGMVITQEEADKLLHEDIIVYYNAVCLQVGDICNSNQVASLTSFAFNVGVSAFIKSTLLKVIKTNPNNLPEIEKQFNRWNKESDGAGGYRVNTGLQKRRALEYQLYARNTQFDG
jgi:lysozyme